MKCRNYIAAGLILGALLTLASVAAADTEGELYHILPFTDVQKKEVQEYTGATRLCGDRIVLVNNVYGTTLTIPYALRKTARPRFLEATPGLVNLKLAQVREPMLREYRDTAGVKLYEVLVHRVDFDRYKPCFPPEPLPRRSASK